MQFSNKLSLAVAALATTTLAFPVSRRDYGNSAQLSSAGAAGSDCAEEGKVVCESQKFQICASGVWSVSMSLALGTDCSVFGAGQSGGEGVLPSNPAVIPVSSNAEIPVPTATAPGVSASASHDLGGQFVERPQTTADQVPSATDKPFVPPNTDTTTTQAAGPTPPPKPSQVQTTKPKPTQQPGNSDDSDDSQGSTTPGAMQSYTGPEANYPKKDKWVTYDTMWNLNKMVCERPDNGGKGPLIKQYIKEVAKAAGLDARVVLAVVLQESTCNLGVGSTDGGVNNPGIMQSHNGVSYAKGDSDDKIKQMLMDGTTGTSSGKGLVQFIEGEGGRLWTGLRAYNSGENGVDESNLFNLPAGTGTASYCSDIANRLTGAKVERM